MIPHFILACAMAMFLTHAVLHAQQHDTVRSTDTITIQDTVGITTADGTSAKGDIDTIVVFSAKDSVHFNVLTKRMRLRGSADVRFREQRLQSEVVIMDFGTSTMYADGVKDSTGRLTGFPLFIDEGEEYAGERIVYNFKSRQGRVTLGETNVEGGFYWGNRIKRVDEKTIYVEDGNFTTCDAPHPHFHFNSPRMKLILDDKIFYDPLIMYVEDIPVFAVPIGLYFDMQHGRHSGIILPTPLITSNRGIVLQRFGYYWAASDYWDTEFYADLTSKGGFTLHNDSRYEVRDVLRGNIGLLYGYTRQSVLDGYTRNMALSASHDQTLGPDEKITARLLFTTTNVFQNTSFNPYERIQQNAHSEASYQRTFYNGHTFNIGYGRDQNMINGSVTHSPTISYSIPTFSPISDLVQLSYRVTGRYYYDARRDADTLPFQITERSVIEHHPSLSVTPKLGYFTFQPSIRYDENWHLQRYTQTVNPDSSVNITRETGFFREYTTSMGVSASTFLYGNMRPNLWGITAFRHTVQPTLSLVYVPDQSDTSLGFFGTYISPYNGQVVRYSRFGGSTIASRNRQLNVGINLLNKFAVKIAQNDTAPDKPLELLTVSANTAYDVMADSLQLKPINVSLHSPVLDFIQFRSSFTFDVYDQVQAIDPISGVQSYVNIGRTMLQSGKGLARLTSMSLGLGSRFSSEGVSFESRATSEDSSAPIDTTGSKLRARFERRVNYKYTESDLFGDDTPGWSSIVIPWEAEFNVSYSYNKISPDLSRQSLLLTLRGNVSLTETLRISASTTLDLITGSLNSPFIDISKQLHCWVLSVNWVPLGANKGFFLRFAADANLLRDMQITKQSTPLYR